MDPKTFNLGLRKAKHFYSNLWMLVFLPKDVFWLILLQTKHKIPLL